MQTEKIKLGEREYQLRELPLRKAREFRAKLQEPFGEVISLLERGPGTPLNDGKAVAQLIRSVSGTVLNSVDTATELLFAYSPEIAADREYVEENAVSSQVTDAFLALLGIVFPFLSTERATGMMRKLGALGSGDKQT